MEENNKIIAEFMGFTFEKNIGYYDNEMLLEQIVYEQQNGNCFDELLFNKDWNWLMAVVEKIETMSNNDQFYIIVEYDNRDEFKGWIWRIDRFVKTLKVNDNRIKTKIEATYNACLEFIKWYNEQII